MAGTAFSPNDHANFGLRLGRLIAPELSPEQLHHAIDRLLTPSERSQLPTAAAPAVLPTLSPAAYAPPAPVSSGDPESAEPEARLEFGHACSHHACNHQRCNVCINSPKKQCRSNFAEKYIMKDALVARCKQEITVSIVAASGHQASQDLACRCHLQMCILEASKAREFICRGGGATPDRDVIEACKLLRTNEGLPLLTAGNDAGSQTCPRLVFPPGKHSIPLRGVKVGDNSESVLSRNQPVCLAVVAVDSETGRRIWNISPLLSEDFLVLTPRAMTPRKAMYPTMEDPVESLQGIGDQTLTKLKDLKFHLDACKPPVHLFLPPELYQIRKVKDFRALMNICLHDADFHQKLIKLVLRVTQDNWRKACEHADRTVKVDHRVRAWYMRDMSCGLLYECTMGDIQPDWPIALLQARGVAGQFDIYPKSIHVPAQRDQMRKLTQQAVRDWNEEGHGNTWNIFFQSMPGGGTREFESMDEIMRNARSGGRIIHEAPSAPWPGSGSSQPFSLPDTTAVTADNHDHALSSGSLPSPPPTPQQYNDPNPAELSPIYEQTLPADVQGNLPSAPIPPIDVFPEAPDGFLMGGPGHDDTLSQYLSNLGQIQHANGLEFFGGPASTDDAAAAPFAAVPGNSLPSSLRLPSDCYAPNPSFNLFLNRGIDAECQNPIGLMRRHDAPAAPGGPQEAGNELLVMSQEFVRLDVAAELDNAPSAAAQEGLSRSALPLDEGIAGGTDSGRLRNPDPPKRRRKAVAGDKPFGCAT